MKIGIDVLGGDFAPEANLRRNVLDVNDLSSKTTTTLIGDQEYLLSGLSLLNRDIVALEIYHTNVDQSNAIIHSWEAANFGFASKINEAYY